MTDELRDVLGQMVELLSIYGEDFWAEALLGLSSRAEVEDIRRHALRLFGGAGSLNDLVLHNDDVAEARRANSDFDALRARLFSLCSQ